MKRIKKLKKTFGVDEYGFISFPAKVSGVKLSRIECDGNGCSFCFPHGYETINASRLKNRRSWKFYRKKQYRKSS